MEFRFSQGHVIRVAREHHDVPIADWFEVSYLIPGNDGFSVRRMMSAFAASRFVADLALLMRRTEDDPLPSPISVYEHLTGGEI